MSSSIVEELVSFKSRSRAPVLWILLPLIAGYIVGRYLKVSEFYLVFGGLGFGLLWGFSWWKGHKYGGYWKVFGLLSIFFLSWVYILTHIPPKLEWGELPEREAYLTLKIGQTLSFEDKFNRKSGYAEIVGAAQHLQTLIGQKIHYLISTNESVLVRGAIIEVKGILSVLNKNEGKGFEKYMLSQGIGFKLYKGQLLKLHKAPSFYQFCAKQNSKMEKILEKGRMYASSCSANICKAMLLGNQTSLTAEQKYAFRITGSLHLFSISGLHVGVIAGCFAFLLRLIKIKNPWAAILGISVLFLYVQVTGGAPSAMRAFLMVVFYWGGRAFQRKSSAFSALSASALVALIMNPFDLWNIGFQFSYAVVGSILLYGLPLNELANFCLNTKFRIRYNIAKNGLRWLINLLGISIAANIGATFLSIYYFNTFAPGSIFLSLVIIPLSSLIIISGFSSLLVGLLGLSFISELINPISWMMIQIMELMIFFSLKIPYLFWNTFLANQIITYMSILILFTFLYLSHRFNQLQKSFFYLIPIGMISAFVFFGF